MMSGRILVRVGYVKDYEAVAPYYTWQTWCDDPGCMRCYGIGNLGYTSCTRAWIPAVESGKPGGYGIDYKGST